MNATRRLWARRVYRAGWMVAPVFASISNTLRSKDFWLIMAIIAVVCAFMGGMFYSLNYDHQDATTEELREVAGNACVKEYFDHRYPHASISRQILKNATNHCKDIAVRAEQMKALK